MITSKQLKFPTLKTDRLQLCQLTPRHRKDLYEIFSDPEVIKYYDLDAFTQLSQADDLIQIFQSRFDQSLGIRWAIKLKDSKKCIGTCGFNSWNNAMHSTTIGYDLSRKYWGQGLMTEAAAAIIQTAFDGNLVCDKINRIQADTVPGNTASERVLVKLGFKQEGLRRQSAYWKNAYHDLKCFGLLKQEFPGK